MNLVGLEFHHIGYACSSIEKEFAVYKKLGYVAEGAEFVDPQQQIRGLFIVHGSQRLELLEPVGKKSPLDQFLKRGIKMYHQAFLTPNLASHLEQFRELGAMTVVQPVPAVAFDRRRIAFVMLPNMDLIELIEKP